MKKFTNIFHSVANAYVNIYRDIFDIFPAIIIVERQTRIVLLFKI